MTFVIVRLLLSTPKHSLIHNIPPLSHLRFPREQSRIARVHTELEAWRERRIIERRLEVTTVRIDLVHLAVATQGQRGDTTARSTELGRADLSRGELPARRPPCAV